MDVILHLGAHRTGSASFQHYMRSGLTRLGAAGVGFWTPARETTGVSADAALPPDAQLAGARARLADNLDLARARGVRQLVISDQYVIGAPEHLLEDGCLYSGIGERMARYAEVFGGRLTRIVLSIRSQDSFWCSIAAHSVAQGHPVPAADVLARVAARRRGWRDVITDLACALGGVEIQVQPFEVFGGLPEHRLAAMTGVSAPPVHNAREWLNRAPGRAELRAMLTKRGEDPDLVPEGDGRWQIFDRDQVRMLREAYADDLFWLRAGADDLARLIDETGPAKAGKHPRAGDTKRGQEDGKDDRRLA